MFKKTFLIICLVLLASCSSQERLPGYLYLRLSSDPSTLDPAYIVDVAGGSISAKLFNGLVGFDKDANVVPDIAASYDVSPDGRTYTFHLRHGVRFTNGREVTAADFKYSYERVLSPATRSPRTWLFDRIKGARGFMEADTESVEGLRVIDDYTLEIDIVSPFGPFLGLLAMPGGYVVPREEVERPDGSFADNPVGTGPYALSQWEHGSRLVLAANPGYFGEEPGLSGILYRVIPEDLTAVAEFERGSLDVIGIPAPVFGRYTKDPKWDGLVLSQVGLNTYYLGLNCSRPPFDDPLLRRAVSYAIDRKRILNTIYEGRGLLADGPVPPVLLPGVSEPFPYHYDPARARTLMADAGYPDGFAMKIFIGSDPETLDMVEVIQQYLKEANVEASITQLEWSAYKQAINAGDADAFWLSWQADYPDPENFLYPVFDSKNFGPAGNRARISDPELDRLIEAAQTEPDPERRMELYRAAQERAIEAAPWVFFWHKKEFVVRQSWVEGYRLYPINNADKGLGVTISNRQ